MGLFLVLLYKWFLCFILEVVVLFGELEGFCFWRLGRGGFIDADLMDAFIVFRVVFDLSEAEALMGGVVLLFFIDCVDQRVGVTRVSLGVG